MNHQDLDNKQKKQLFIACFAALVATSFGFILRAFSLGDWGKQFALDNAQLGEIFGAGLWPFAISMIIFSLFVDKIGYKKSMLMALICHISSAIITIMAQGYWSLYAGAFICALGNGIVEAVINPVTASMYSKEKTKYLNILHAGWPAGFVIAGLMSLMLNSSGGNWQVRIAMIALPTAVYAFFMMKSRFPVDERVRAGIPYKDMLKTFGALSCFLILTLTFYELSRVYCQLKELSSPSLLSCSLLAVAFSALFGFKIKSWGHPLYFIICLLMVPLAITELGTDGWIKELLGPAMETAFKLSSEWALIFSATIMMILRFNAGRLTDKLSAPSILAISSFFATLGLLALSQAHGFYIVLAFVLYAIGQTYFWPTILGFVSERFPSGGAITINSIAAVGMLAVGILGAPLLGMIQDYQVSQQLQEKMSPYGEVQTIEKDFFNFRYRTSTLAKAKEAIPIMASVHALEEQSERKQILMASAEYQQASHLIQKIDDSSKRKSLAFTAIFPAFMCFSFGLMILYFRRRGGYKKIALQST